ncbi:MAG: ribbon-helix-helix protein, CopG family [Solirubrobacteraceae bacterium]
MVKTTVYLREEEASALRRLSERTGRSQAEIIREAVAAATREVPKRHFHAMGVGSGTGEPVAQHADEIVRREWSLRGP